MKDFPIYKDEDRVTWLAYFFERLARRLLHTKQRSPEEWMSTRCQCHFDVYDYPVAFIEVKAASNGDTIKIFKDQLDAQLDEVAAAFPVAQAFIWIFSYINSSRTPTFSKEGKQRHRLLKYQSGKSWKGLARFLSSHTNSSYIIDIRLLDLLRNVKGTTPYKRNFYQTRHTINISRTMLKELALDARATLLKLGLPEDELPDWLPPKAKGWRPRYVSATLDGRKIKFKLVLLLMNGAKQRFLNQLNGNVCKAAPTKTPL